MPLAAQTNTETRIGEFPNGVTVTYPASASNILLPLTIANGFQPEILVCGGTYKSVNLDANPATLSARKYASNLCFRMVINKAGIKRGWQTETMPEARLMGDALLMPDGKVSDAWSSSRSANAQTFITGPPYQWR